MNCKEIIDNVLSREGLYRVIADPFATTDLIVQENIRILNQLVKALVLKNSLSDLLRECKFRTYQEFSAGTELVVGAVIYSGPYRYRCVNAAIPQIDPATLGLQPGESGEGADDVQWECLGDWNQYPFADLADDIASIDTATMMNLDQRVEMTALNMHQWAKLKASAVAVGTTGLYTVRNKSIYIFPGLAPNTPISFLYYTSKPIIGVNGDIKPEFKAADDDTEIPAQILILGTAYRYLKDKDIGRWDQLEIEYNTALSAYEARGTAPQQIDIAGGVTVNASNYSDGNWNVGA